MSTSANVIYYEIYNKDGKLVKTHRQNFLCKSRRHELLEYTPAEDYKIIVRWPDEDEVEHYSKEMSLVDYLNGVKCNWSTDF